MKGEDPARATATDYVGNFLFKFRVFSAFAERMRVDGEPFDSTSPSIKAALEPKSTETVRKRAGSLRMFVGWFANSAFFKGCPFDEITVFNYLGYLNSERVPATRGSTFRETVHWMGALFGFEVEATQKSSRVRGLSIRLLKTRGVLKQRDPLTVAMVTTLEEIATDADGFQDDFDIVIAGAALFVLYSRARVGDVARSATEPTLDLAPDRSEGYIQGALLDHKTAKPGTRRSLPLAAPAFGVTGRDWATAWMDARRKQRLDASCGTLLQAPAVTGGWTPAPFSTMEFGSAFRNLLLRNGHSALSLANVGSHSLKVTTLSWLAKRGVDRDVRRSLGYHIKQDEVTMEAYSRDALAGPLRTLTTTISEIRAGKFLPDVTRSGQLQPKKDEALASSSSSSAAPRSSSSEDADAAAHVEEEVKICQVLDIIIRNSSSRCLHIMTADDMLICGRPVPTRYAFLDALPEPPAKFCGGCF